MFGSNNNKKETKAIGMVPAANSHALNSIVEGTAIEGDIKTDNDIRIDGKLIGTLDCQGKVIIGPKGYIDGDISCDNALIEGSFSGLLSVRDTLTVNQSAKIKGDINTEKLIVHSGATFNVNCNMGTALKAGSSAPAIKSTQIHKDDLSSKKDEVISFTESPLHKKS